MKKKNYSVMTLIQKAIIDSMNFSKENGKQIFINVSPHIDAVMFYAYPGAWDISAIKVFDIWIYTRGNVAPTVKECKKMLQPIYDYMKESQNI